MEDLKIPNHVAIILDGNRRWAKKHLLPKLEGHKRGFNNIKNIAKYIFNKGVSYLSVYCFSTENFKREVSEVSYLMDLFVKEFRESAQELADNNIKVVFSGRSTGLREDVLEAIEYLKNKTATKTGGILNICLNYGGQTEIVDACKKIALQVKNDDLNLEAIDINTFNNYLYQNLPPVDLMIRTGGDLRVSNFLLWQIAYAEMYFPDVYWPDFNELEFDNAILAYNGRERRFGGGK